MNDWVFKPINLAYEPKKPKYDLFPKPDYTVSKIDLTPQNDSLMTKYLESQKERQRFDDKAYGVIAPYPGGFANPFRSII